MDLREYSLEKDRKTLLAKLLLNKIKESLPLSFSQEQLWILDQLKPNSSYYNIPVGVRLSGKLDFINLEKSLNKIVERLKSYAQPCRERGRARASGCI